MGPLKQTAKPLKAEDILAQQANVRGQSSRLDNIEVDDGRINQQAESLEKILPSVPRGRPKSGRLWKSERKQRYSEMTIDKPLKTSWKKKMKARAEKKSVKAFEMELKEAKAKELEDKRKRVEARKKVKEEMQRRGEIVQPIKNQAKIKRMKKKQLRTIQKK